jgi:hypothetical protein
MRRRTFSDETLSQRVPLQPPLFYLAPLFLQPPLLRGVASLLYFWTMPRFSIHSLD